MVCREFSLSWEWSSSILYWRGHKKFTVMGTHRRGKRVKMGEFIKKRPKIPSRARGTKYARVLAGEGIITGRGRVRSNKKMGAFSLPHFWKVSETFLPRLNEHHLVLAAASCSEEIRGSMGKGDQQVSSHRVS